MLRSSKNIAAYRMFSPSKLPIKFVRTIFRIISTPVYFSEYGSPLDINILFSKQRMKNHLRNRVKRFLNRFWKNTRKTAYLLVTCHSVPISPVSPDQRVKRFAGRGFFFFFFKKPFPPKTETHKNF